MRMQASLMKLRRLLASATADDMDIEDKFGDSEDGPDNDQDAFCDFKEDDENEGEEEEDEVGFDASLFPYCLNNA
jgi:hypothetical protein